MRRLGELTYPEVERLLAEEPIALLPVGSTEAHGPHLPLGTDAILSEELAARAARALGEEGYEAVIAPAVAYAVTEYANEFAGTLSLPPATATALFEGIIGALVDKGFLRVCVINNHLEPAHVEAIVAGAARVAARTGTAILFPNQLERRWGRTLTAEFKSGACHAGSYESSLVLAARPELVDETLRGQLAARPIDLARAIREGKRTFVAAGIDQAYCGDPAAASVEEGNLIYARLVDMVLTEIRARWPRG